MTRRKRSRDLAVPFVVTASVLQGCAPSRPADAAPRQPVATTSPTTAVEVPAPTQAPAEPSEPVATETPPEPPEPSPHRQWSITKDGEQCEAQLATSCPEGAKCNPPAPIAYACPEVQSPLSVRFPATVTRAEGATECTLLVWRRSNVQCKPGRTCNPPPPRREQHPVSCPDD